MSSRWANPRFIANDSVTLGFRISPELAARLQRIILERDCSIHELFAAGIDAIERQAEEPVAAE